MGIPENQFEMIWRAIKYWRDKLGWSSEQLNSFTSQIMIKPYSTYRIEKGITSRDEWLTSEFVHACFEVFGLPSHRLRGSEELADILTDQECISALISPIIESHQQSKFRL